MTNKIKGGLADGKSTEDIAKKHKVSVDKIKSAVAKGIAVEREHTKDDAKAREIVMDHLMESPDYYDALEDMEANLEKATSIPPDHGSVPDLDGKTKHEYSKRHDALATQYALAGDKEKASHHRKQAQAYYGDMVDIKKEELEVVSPSGHIDRFQGKEPLKKPVQKSLADRWNLLKAEVTSNADQAFISMEDEPDAGEAVSSGEDHEPELTPDTQTLDPEHIDAIHGADDEQNPEQPEQQPQQDEQSQDEGSDLSDEDMAALEEALREQGHSESEIAYILHSHLPPQTTIEDHKIANEEEGGKQKRDHQQNLHDVELDHKKKMFELEQKKKQSEVAALDPDLEKDHAKKLKELEFEKAKKQLEAEDYEGEKAHKQKLRDLELQMKQEEIAVKSGKNKLAHEQRLMDLEFEKAKLEMEMDLDIKRKEAELKLKQKEAMIKQGTKEKQELQGIKHEQNKVNAANPEPIKQEE